MNGNFKGLTCMQVKLINHLIALSAYFLKTLKIISTVFGMIYKATKNKCLGSHQKKIEK